MMPTDPVSVSLSGTDYILRFTLPRLREMNVRTGKGTAVLLAELTQLNFDALAWLLWAAVTHPGNPTLKSATPEQVLELVDAEHLRDVIQALAAAAEKSFAAAPAAKNGNPQ